MFKNYSKRSDFNDFSILEQNESFYDNTLNMARFARLDETFLIVFQPLCIPHFIGAVLLNPLSNVSGQFCITKALLGEKAKHFFLEPLGMEEG